MKIELATKIDQEITSAFKKLIPQLDTTVTSPTLTQLKEIVSSPFIFLFIARNSKLKNKIIGTITLVAYRTPTGLHARVEDLVVEKKSRGKGIGTALLQAALYKAKIMKANMVDLTSRSSRKAANLFYKNLGFKKRKTNVYRYNI